MKMIIVWLVFSHLAVSSFSYANSEFVNRPQRLKIFESVQLTSETEKMDELEKDMLVIRAQKLDINQLKKQYPQISSDKLKNLQQSLGSRIK